MPTQTIDNVRILTIDQAHALFPSDLKLSKEAFTRYVLDHGLYRQIAKKQFMTMDDVRAVLEQASMLPTEEQPVPGSSIFGDAPEPHAFGVIVVIGAQGVYEEDSLFVRWVHKDEVADLVKLVQVGCEYDVAVKAFRTGTPAMLSEFAEEWANNRHQGDWYAVTQSFRKAIRNFMATEEVKHEHEHGPGEGQSPAGTGSDSGRFEDQQSRDAEQQGPDVEDRS